MASAAKTKRIKCDCGNPAKIKTNDGCKYWKCFMSESEYKARFGKEGVADEK